MNEENSIKSEVSDECEAKNIISILHSPLSSYEGNSRRISSSYQTPSSGKGSERTSDTTPWSSECSSSQSFTPKSFSSLSLTPKSDVMKNDGSDVPILSPPHKVRVPVHFRSWIVNDIEDDEESRSKEIAQAPYSSIDDIKDIEWSENSSKENLEPFNNRVQRLPHPKSRSNNKFRRFISSTPSPDYSYDSADSSLSSTCSGKLCDDRNVLDISFTSRKYFKRDEAFLGITSSPKYPISSLLYDDDTSILFHERKLVPGTTKIQCQKREEKTYMKDCKTSFLTKLLIFVHMITNKKVICGRSRTPAGLLLLIAIYIFTFVRVFLMIHEDLPSEFTSSYTSTDPHQLRLSTNHREATWKNKGAVSNEDHQIIFQRTVAGLSSIIRRDNPTHGAIEWIRTGRKMIGEGDPELYLNQKEDFKRKHTTQPRIVILSSSEKHNQYRRKYIKVYPTEFSDNTQLYGIRSSDDPALANMEPVIPLKNNECSPMQKWQTSQYPTCNRMHELDLSNLEDKVNGKNITLFGTNGYFRNAWTVDVHTPYKSSKRKELAVLKTLRYMHNFEEARYELHRIDAMAMERLTSSPHVMNIYGFCGNSVITEYADGPRIGTLADKAKKYPLKRLKIARDIASGLADVHGIDGENASFVHFDINPANVVVVEDTLKLNDFNTGILLRWNHTSHSQCGFPAQYPNPQWRSPEEASGSKYLTEKIDVYSMGNIFFRLICGHEPWNKLEIGGKPKDYILTRKIKNGYLPRIPDNVLASKDPEVKAILKAMLGCYTFDPNERPSARLIADYLDSEIKRLSSN